MNHHEIRHLFSPHTAAFLGGKLIVVLVTIFFWVVMFALVSCPVWLPGLVDRAFPH
ncbi:MAG TPA: hypothetical protein VF813_02420 [Anaerolineaceae bacterium]